VPVATDRKKQYVFPFDLLKRPPGSREENGEDLEELQNGC
jgi:hypothetical protein